MMIQRDVVKSGVGFGSALAMVISYSAYKSVLWAIIHGVFGWFYVGYFLLTR
jgi:hypothetical protein